MKQIKQTLYRGRHCKDTNARKWSLPDMKKNSKKFKYAHKRIVYSC